MFSALLLLSFLSLTPLLHASPVSSSLPNSNTFLLDNIPPPVPATLRSWHKVSSWTYPPFDDMTLTVTPPPLRTWTYYSVAAFSNASTIASIRAYDRDFTIKAVQLNAQKGSLRIDAVDLRPTQFEISFVDRTPREVTVELWEYSDQRRRRQTALDGWRSD